MLANLVPAADTDHDTTSLGGGDFEPTKVPREFWLNRGSLCLLPLLDAAGNLRVQQTKFYLATTSLINGHAADRSGQNYPHAHFLDDYRSVPEANRFWDARFDAPRSSVRTSDASTQINGGAHTLRELITSRTITCWVDDNLNAFGDIFEAETGVNYAEVTAAKDNNHLEDTTAASQSSDAAAMVTEILWKVGPSGVYRARPAAFDEKRVKQFQLK